MPGWTYRPFALFNLAEHDHETINRVLKAAISGTSTPDFWLVTGEYADAPVKKKGRHINLGTAPPILKDFTSAFVGKKVEDAAQWLRGKPETVDLDAHHFGLLDKRSGLDNTVVLCKVGDKNLHGDELDYFRYPSKQASTFLLGMQFGEWEELKENAKKSKRRAEIEY